MVMIILIPFNKKVGSGSEAQTCNLKWIRPQPLKP